MKKENNNNKHSKDWTNSFLIILTILFAIFAIISLCFYANKMGNMKFKDIFHFWNYISSENSDWDTFSFLLSGAIDCAFSGITLLFVIVQYYNGLKEKKESEIEKLKEKKTHFLEKNKIEQEKRREKYEHQIEQENIEKDKFTVRYIEDMEKLNHKLFEIYGPEIYETYNKKIEKSIYIWLLLESFKNSNYSNYSIYQKLENSFPLRNSILEEPIPWDTFKKLRDLNNLYTLLFNSLNISDEIKHEILENVGDTFSIEKCRSINDDMVRQIIYNNTDRTLQNLLKMVIEHFIFAMRSLDDYQEGINYYFLQLPEEQRFFFAFISKNEEIITIVKDAIEQTNLLEDGNSYLILKLIKKIN